MDSLCTYDSDEEDNNCHDREIGVRHEDVNYDHLTMEMSDEELSPEQSSPHSTSLSTSSNDTNNDNQAHSKYCSSEKKSSRKSTPSSHDSRSPPHTSQNSRKGLDSFSDKKKHEKSKSKDENDSYKGRKRSPVTHHHRERSRRSPSYGRDKYSHRNDSPQRRIREKERSRSPRRHPTAFERKTNKLSLLEKLGIEIKMPEESKHIETSLPGYYNPMVVNSTKYAEQVAKRKLLWSGKKQEPQGKEEVGESKSCAMWQGAKFSEDQDGKLTAKFHRLMGIKHNTQGESSNNTLPPVEGNSKDIIKKQEEMFSSMELQYEVARVATHTQRGVGLGFGAHHFARL